MPRKAQSAPEAPVAGRDAPLPETVDLRDDHLRSLDTIDTPAETHIAAAEYFPAIPIEQLHESPHNPRRRFNQESLQELAESFRTFGVLTPLLARPTSNGGGPAYELAAGHRRFRAATLAGVAELPVLVRPMSDAQLIEILNIDNLQREDVHPLEEAQGFADLIKHAGYDVPRIAARLGKSIKYVYDRVKLLQLTPAVQEIFFAGEITAGHAILLARLSADDQARALSTLGAVFTSEITALTPEQAEQEDAEDQREVNEWEEELCLGDRRKPMSVRELQHWIDKHVRFVPTAPDVVDLFPETAAVVAPAIEQAEKIISITHEHFIQPEGRAEDERTFGPRSWTRADGQFESEECEHSVIGVVAIGPGRGEAFRVCIAKKKCLVHWGREIRESAKRAKEREQGDGGGADRLADRGEAARAKQEAERQAEEAKRQAFQSARPAILDAIAAQLKKQKTGAGGPLGQLLINKVKQYGSTPPKGLAPGSSAEDLVRYLAFIVLADQARYHNAHEALPRLLKPLGVDVAAILKGETEPKFPKAAKKSAKKKAKARR